MYQVMAVRETLDSTALGRTQCLRYKAQTRMCIEFSAGVDNVLKRCVKPLKTVYRKAHGCTFR